jgi:hypothetical protein
MVKAFLGAVGVFYLHLVIQKCAHGILLSIPKIGDRHPQKA